METKSTVKEARGHLHEAEQRAQTLVDLLEFNLTLRGEIEAIRATIEKAQDALEDSPRVLRLHDDQQ